MIFAMEVHEWTTRVAESARRRGGSLEGTQRAGTAALNNSHLTTETTQSDNCSHWKHVKTDFYISLCIQLLQSTDCLLHNKAIPNNNNNNVCYCTNVVLREVCGTRQIVDKMKPRLSSASKDSKAVAVEVERAATEIVIEDVSSSATQCPNEKYSADHYSCQSPPIFVVFITLVELGVFTYYSTTATSLGPAGPIPIDSPFMYRPDRRYEVWRFVLYMLLHAGWVHLLINLSVQLVVGLPLEFVHGSWRVACIYISGVIAGSLSTSVFEPKVYLIGASGGVYALLTTHLANVMLNYKQMQFPWMRIVGVMVIAGSDVRFAVYNRYMEPDELPVSSLAHMAGALAGLTAGLLLLKNFERKFHEHFLWWTALVVFTACMLFAILYNIFNFDGVHTPREIY